MALFVSVELEHISLFWYGKAWYNGRQDCKIAFHVYIPANRIPIFDTDKDWLFSFFFEARSISSIYCNGSSLLTAQWMESKIERALLSALLFPSGVRAPWSSYAAKKIASRPPYWYSRQINAGMRYRLRTVFSQIEFFLKNVHMIIIMRINCKYFALNSIWLGVYCEKQKTGNIKDIRENTNKFRVITEKLGWTN